MTTPTPQLLSIIGPTASGKSRLAVQVAQRLSAEGRASEIVNTDSMLVYRGMDIGTAKPSAAERGDVPHHLIDLWPVTHTATVADFQGLARAAIADCQARGVFPVLVGGSALYVRAVLDEFEFPATDPAVRAELEAELGRIGSLALHRRLEAASPETAAGIEPLNGRRVVRALEVIAITGGYVSVLPTFRYALPGVVQIGLSVERAELDARIDARTEGMWRAGLVEEVRGLLDEGLREGVTASRAIGYRQVLQHLDGELDDAEARAATAARTRRFARKQLGWWRRDDRIHWLPGGHAESLERALRLVGR